MSYSSIDTATQKYIIYNEVNKGKKQDYDCCDCVAPCPFWGLTREIACRWNLNLLGHSVSLHVYTTFKRGSVFSGVQDRFIFLDSVQMFSSHPFLNVWLVIAVAQGDQDDSHPSSSLLLSSLLCLFTSKTFSNCCRMTFTWSDRC